MRFVEAHLHCFIRLVLSSPNYYSQKAFFIRPKSWKSKGAKAMAIWQMKQFLSNPVLWRLLILCRLECSFAFSCQRRISCIFCSCRTSGVLQSINVHLRIYLCPFFITSFFMTPKQLSLFSLLRELFWTSCKAVMRIHFWIKVMCSFLIPSSKPVTVLGYSKAFS